MEATINEKAMRGVETYLERRGMEILERGWAHGKDSIDFVADDEGDLVFISCKIRQNDSTGIPTDTPDRKMFERIAAAYLAEHDETNNCYVRFDIVSMLIINDGKALLRHHRNALSVADTDLD